MATKFIIWSQKDRCIVPNPYTLYPSSQDATDAIRRMVGKAGNHKDKQGQLYDVISVTVT